MKVKEFLIISLITLSVFVSGCMGPSDDDIILEAQGDKDHSLCEKIKDTDKKEECVAGVAMETHDVNLCERLSTKERTETILGVTTDYNLRDLCYRSIADDTLNADICSKISDISERNDCIGRIAVTSKNPELCEKMSTEKAAVELYSKDDCYWYIVFNTKNTSLCERMSDKDKRDSCKETFKSIK